MYKLRTIIASIISPIGALITYDLSMVILLYVIRLLSKIPILNWLVGYNVILSGGIQLFVAFSCAEIALAASAWLVSVISDDSPSAFVAAGIIVIAFGLIVVVYNIIQGSFHVSNLVFPCIGGFLIGERNG